jgi:aarF domain-containing kinase
LDDGRVGFIDFGIVGRVSEKTFEAVSDLSIALALADYTAMAEALCKMGATDEKVDTKKFGRDIETVMRRISTVQPDITLAELADGTVAGSINFDDNEITNVLLEIVAVTEDNGLKLPREFGLLVKQSVYFDRYLKILAPGVDVMSDSRFTGLGSAEVAEGVPRINGSGQGSAEVVIDV